MKKISVVLSVILLIFVGIVGTACKKPNVIDTSKTQLYIGNYDGGFGGEWLHLIKQRFETEYQNHEFEAGKRGVQLIIDNSKITYTGSSIATAIATSSMEVFFSEMNFYNDYVIQKLLLDITDVVTGDLSELGDSGSIEDKLTGNQRAFFKQDNKYYALPHYEAFHGIMYNLDYFETNRLYFSSNINNGNNGFVLNGKNLSERSLGPDGKTGIIDGLDYSVDDGLPSTYAEFYKLCERIRSIGDTPITWMALNQKYVNMLISALADDYEGIGNAMLNYTFDGTAENIITGFDTNNNPIIESVAISEQNAGELYKQAGRYYALKFVEELVRKEYYSKNNSFNTTYSHLMAQSDFLYTGFDPIGEKIAMLVDGNWWENEAASVFTEMSDIYIDADKYSRRIGYMPLPKATEDKIGENSTLIDSHLSLGFIKKNIAPNKIELAKLFLKYCHTARSLAEFTVSTGTSKSYQYELTNAQYNSLSYYQKSLWDYRKKSDVGYSYSGSELYKSNQSRYVSFLSYSSRVNSTTYDFPSSTFRNTYVTAKDYFLGIAVYYSV